jgi:hypothetical protein
MSEHWPICGDGEPGTKDGGCLLRRGHPGVHRSDSGFWGDDARRIEQLMIDADEDRETHRRVRAAVVAIDTNYVGQEGRGAAASVRDIVLRLLDAELR